MNETVRSLLERKSVRLFTDEAVTEEERKTILEAAAAAPTAGNQQLYTILDVTDEELKKTLGGLCDGQHFIADAPLMLVFLADTRKWLRGYRLFGGTPRDPGAGDLILAVDDALIAAQNAVTAAESLGIGSCYIGDIMENCEKVREVLRLPEYVFPAALTVFGRPTPSQAQRPKPERLPLRYIVKENTYGDYTDEELTEMFTFKAGGKDPREWMNAFQKRKYDSDFSVEMSRSVAEYLKDFV